MSAQNASPTRLVGVRGVKTRALLEALFWTPQTPTQVAQTLGTSTTRTWSLMQHLLERQLIERQGQAQYQTSSQGRTLLYPKHKLRTPLVRPERLTKPPVGWHWTAERVAWLERYYPVLGPRRCAELLVRESAHVAAKAAALGLRWGHDLEGFLLLTELVSLSGRNYANLRQSAKKAGALTYLETSVPTSKNGRSQRHGAMVPETWAAQILQECEPPLPGEVALLDLRTELGLSKTHANRLAGADTLLRTRNTGGMAQLYVTEEVAARIRERWQSRPKRVPLGQPAVRAVVQAAGEAGLTQGEIQTALNCQESLAHSLVLVMWRSGQFQRCRSGGASDPFIYRLAQWQGHATPAARPVLHKRAV